MILLLVSRLLCDILSSSEDPTRLDSRNALATSPVNLDTCGALSECFDADLESLPNNHNERRLDGEISENDMNATNPPPQTPSSVHRNHQKTGRFKEQRNEERCETDLNAHQPPARQTSKKLRKCLWNCGRAIVDIYTLVTLPLSAYAVLTRSIPNALACFVVVLSSSRLGMVSNPGNEVKVKCPNLGMWTCPLIQRQ